MPLVSVRNLKVYFKVREGWVRAVDDVNLDIDAGETVGLVGESGCGKTTLAYAITQLLPTNAHVLGGQIFFDADKAVGRFGAQYRQLAEERMSKEIAQLEATLRQSPLLADGNSEPEDQARLREEIDLLRHPLSSTYRTHLAREIQEIEGRIAKVSAQAAAGDSAASRLLAELKARLRAASQEGDLIDITRLRNGTLRQYDSRLNAVRWKQISIVFQGAMNALNPVYTVGDQILEAIQAHDDIEDDAGRKRIEELYRLVGIPRDRIDNYPHEYSGGMKQRAMIAMALALNPKLVIMDEPTTALDVITAAKIMDEVIRIQRELKTTLLVISHDVSTVAKVTDRICVMYAGQLVEESTSMQIFNETLHPYSRGLLSSFPSVKGTKHRIEAIPGSPPSLVNPPSGCRFHPRCSYAKDICTTTGPEYFRTPDGKHRAMCHFSGDFLAQGGLPRT